MKVVYSIRFPLLALAVAASFFACSKKNNQSELPSDGCYVQLFDGDNFRGANIVVKGEGEFTDLKNLPGAKKDWDAEADSFKSGENTTVTFWPEVNFQGSPITYDGGSKVASMEEPRSMKITCK